MLPRNTFIFVFDLKGAFPNVLGIGALQREGGP